MKRILAVFAVLLLFTICGCICPKLQPSFSEFPADAGAQQQGAPGSSSGAIAQQPGSSAGAQQEEASSKLSAEEAQGSKTDYIVYATIFQYSKQTRSKMNDVMVKAYGIEVDISNVSGGIGSGKPLSDHKKAIVKLTGPSSVITLVPGPITKQEYDALPVMAAWPFMPDYVDSTQDSFIYAKNGSILPGGSYTLTIDADGDGKLDGEATFIIPGVQVTNPTFGSKQSASGFSLQWSQAGKPKDMFYTITTGQGFAGLDNYLANSEQISGTSIAVTPATLNDQGSIETGNYLLNFQVDSALPISDYEDYAMGKSQKKTVFAFFTVKEAHNVLYSIGDFCHCEDAFMDRPCTMDELTADPLCMGEE